MSCQRVAVIIVSIAYNQRKLICADWTFIYVINTKNKFLFNICGWVGRCLLTGRRAVVSATNSKWRCGRHWRNND